MGWASGFQAGTALGRQLVDTYEKAQQKREFEKIANTKPEELQGYTAADGQQLEAIANAKDANGNPYYNLEARPDGSYGLRANFQIAGADGAMAQPPEVSVAPRRLTEFMGRRYEGEMTPDQIDMARSRAYADAVSKADPVLGLRMRRDIKADERADTEFQWRVADRPIEQRSRELQLSGAERGERQGVRLEDVQKVRDQAAKLSEKELENMAAQVNLGTMPAIYTGRTDKNGFTFIATDKEGRPIPGKTYELNAAQVRQLATAHLLGQAGFGGESFAELTAASKDIAEHIRAVNGDFFKTATLGNDAAAKSGKLDNDRAELGIKRAVANAQQGYYNRPSFLTLENANGEAVLVDQKQLRTNPDGTLALPQGTRVPGKAKTANVDGNILFVDNKPIARVDANGEPKPFGPDPFEGKAGMQRQAELESRGVYRVTMQDKNTGRYVYGYINQASPDDLHSTPESALQAGQAAQAPRKSGLPEPRTQPAAPVDLGAAGEVSDDIKQRFGGLGRSALEFLWRNSPAGR